MLTFGLKPNVNTLTLLVLTLIDWFIFRTLLGASEITQCRMPTQSFWKSPTFFCLPPQQVDHNKFQRPWQVLECCTHFPQLFVWERKKNWSWDWSWGRSWKNPTQIWPWNWGRSLKESHTIMAIFVWDSFQLLPQLHPWYATVTSPKNELQC